MKFVQLLATNILFSKTFMCIRLESIPDPPCCTWLRICWVYRRAGDFCTCEYLRNLDFSVTPNFRFLFPFCRPIRLFSACQLYCSNCLTVFLVFQNADHGRPAESFLATRSSYFLISGIFFMADYGTTADNFPAAQSAYQLYFISYFMGAFFRMRTTAGRQTVFPRRGVLASYRPVGCPYPPPVADGRLVNLTQLQARYRLNGKKTFYPL